MIAMFAVIAWPLLVAIIGGLLYRYAKVPVLQHVGDVMLWCGVLWTVYLLTGSSFQIGHHA